MEEYTVRAGAALSGELQVPGDKSVSHRAVILSAIARGNSVIRGLNTGQDVFATKQIFSGLGIVYKEGREGLEIDSPGIKNWESGGLRKFDCMNSGTTTRLLTGLFAATPGLECVLDGDESLRRRPMKRILEPLAEMGADIESQDGLLPLKIRGRQLRGISYNTPMASAQVKSALMLAGLQARGSTVIREKETTRDHTERFFRFLHIPVFSEGLKVKVRPMERIPGGFSLTVPGDPSSAAFWIAAALIVPGSSVTIRNVCLNPGRIRYIGILKRAGARISISMRTGQPEPTGDIDVRYSRLRSLRILSRDAASVIDEYPILALIASRASGDSIFNGAMELRYKESDRIRSIVDTLTVFGVETEEYPGGFRVSGGSSLRGGRINPGNDHRIAMMAAIAGLVSREPVIIEDPGVATVSYPDFYSHLEGLVRG